MIEGLIKSYKKFKNKTPGMSSYGAGYPSSINVTSHSRLAWCYGDLGICYSFLYASKVLKDKKIEKEFLEMIDLILVRGITDSGLVHFDDYSFFDTGFCHGLSGIYYILYKINELMPNEIIEEKILYWSQELIKNIKIQLSVEGEIFFPKSKQSNLEVYSIDKEFILNGVCGVGLVLLTLKYKKADWSNIFLLY
jgi:lantibiotic modifying enzyme